jgi:hypothetical protein
MYPVRGVLTDDAIYEALADEERLKRLKSLQGLVEVAVTPVTEASQQLYGRLDECLLPIEPFPREEMKIVQKELHDFAPPPLPFNEFLNNLYLYPESLSVKHSGHSNLQVSVQLVDGALLNQGKMAPFDAVFPPLYSYAPSVDTVAAVKLVKEGFSAVQWQESRPQYGDEFKVMLPPRLTTHTLLFTFYVVNLNSKNMRNIVGFAAMPVFREDGII